MPARPRVEDDPLRADLAALIAAQAMTRAALADAPGFASLLADLCAAHLTLRRVPLLPEAERTVEAVIRHLLGDPAPLSPKAARMAKAVETGDLSAYRAPRGYRPFRPVPLWPDLRPLAFSATTAVEARATEGAPEEGEGRTHRARRRKADQIERTDSFILHKFEAILSWAEFINLNRRVEDDENDDAKKAADDMDEIGLGQISKAPATRLKLHLDLAPEDVDREALSGEATYPEWDARSGAYLPAHARVLTSPAEASEEEPAFRTDPRAARRIRLSSASSRRCVPLASSPPATATATSWTPTARSAPAWSCWRPARATTGSGCRTAAKSATSPSRSSSTSRARPRRRCRATAMRDAR